MTMTTSETIAAIIASVTLLVTIAGLLFIWFQLRLSVNIAKGTLLLSINKDLHDYADIAVQIEEAADENWVANLSGHDRERLLDYLSYFEGVYLLHSSGLLTIGEINYYFSGRFFRLVNNTSVQIHILTNEARYADIFRPVFLLHKVLFDYREKNGFAVLENPGYLEAHDPDLYTRMTSTTNFLRLTP